MDPESHFTSSILKSNIFRHSMMPAMYTEVTFAYFLHYDQAAVYDKEMGFFQLTICLFTWRHSRRKFLFWNYIRYWNVHIVPRFQTSWPERRWADQGSGISTDIDHWSPAVPFLVQFIVGLFISGPLSAWFVAIQLAQNGLFLASTRRLLCKKNWNGSFMHWSDVRYAWLILFV